MGPLNDMRRMEYEKQEIDIHYDVTWRTLAEGLDAWTSPTESPTTSPVFRFTRTLLSGSSMITVSCWRQGMELFRLEDGSVPILSGLDSSDQSGMVATKILERNSVSGSGKSSQIR
jgi:hypothetical protein